MKSSNEVRFRVVDSHTGGEPTRTVIDPWPELSGLNMMQCRELLRSQLDWVRTSTILEPRGSDVLVGAQIAQAIDPSSTAGVVFFNNVSYLNMCGHGTIGIVVTLGYLGRISAGTHRIETPVGTVTVDYDGKNQVSFENVPSYRYRAGVEIDVPEVGRVVGDIAWGGNWFFLTDSIGGTFDVGETDRLTQIACRIREKLTSSGITGADGGEIDHIELFAPGKGARNRGRNFVLCPGKAYDRSPCGTGTSAKLACLAAAGKLAPGETWTQVSIIGSEFEGTYRVVGDRIVPRVTGTAYITGDNTVILQQNDPFRVGIRA